MAGGNQGGGICQPVTWRPSGSAIAIDRRSRQWADNEVEQGWGWGGVFAWRNPSLAPVAKRLEKVRALFPQAVYVLFSVFSRP